jgi:hypothetical protein
VLDLRRDGLSGKQLPLRICGVKGWDSDRSLNGREMCSEGGLGWGFVVPSDVRIHLHAGSQLHLSACDVRRPNCRTV